MSQIDRAAGETLRVVAEHEEQDASKITISEVFGPTIQGEGPLIGRRSTFVRLGLCNLDCLNCDTPYTWDWKGRTGKAYDRNAELSVREVADVAGEASALGAGIVVISGGEPFVQRRALGSLVHHLHAFGHHVQIETNGTIDPGAGTWLDSVTLVVSPKLAAMPTTKPAIRPGALIAYRDLGAHLKLVCASRDDVQEAAALVEALHWDPQRVWIMPEGVATDVIDANLRAIADPTVRAGFNLTTRLHITAWGNTRGH